MDEFEAPTPGPAHLAYHNPNTAANTMDAAARPKPAALPIGHPHPYVPSAGKENSPGPFPAPGAPSSSVVDLDDGEFIDASLIEFVERPIAAPPAAAQKGQASQHDPRRESHRPGPAPAAAAAAPPAVPSFMAPTSNSMRRASLVGGAAGAAPAGHAAPGAAAAVVSVSALPPAAAAASAAGGGASAGPTSLDNLRAKLDGMRRESMWSTISQGQGGIDGLRARVDILRRETVPRTEAPPPDASQGRLSGEPGSGSGAAASAGGSQGTAPGQAAGGPRPLRVLAAELFEEGAFVQECQEALTKALKSSKDGATKDSRIMELAELVRTLRRCLRKTLDRSTQMVQESQRFESDAQRQLDEARAAVAAAGPGVPGSALSAQTSEAELKAQLAQLRAMMAKQESQAKQAAASASLDVDRLTGDLRRCEREVERMTQERDLAREQQRRAEAARNQAEGDLKTTRRDCKDAVRASEVERERLTRELNETRKEATRREEELRTSCAAADRRSDDLEARATTAEARLSDTQQLRAQLETDLRSREDEIARLRREAEELRSVEARLRGDLSRTSVELERARGELEGVKSALLKCQSDLSSRSHELRDARSELEDGRRAHARDGSEWRQERERLLLQGQELVDRSARLELERAGLAASLEHWQHQARELQGRVERAREAEAVLTRQLDDARRHVDTLTSEGQAARARSQTLEAELADVSDSLARAKAEAAEAAARLEQVEGELEALKEATGGDDRNALSRLVSRVATLEASAAESESKRRRLQNEVIELKGNIRVFCRVRPSTGASSAVTCLPDGSSLKLASGGKDHPFAFDKVFGPQSGQDSIFNEVSELVQSALDGFKVCLFSYGQTGAGKTHTMQGAGSGNGRGIIPRAIDKILECSAKLRGQGWEHHLEASFVEIYNESLRDLLQGGAKLDDHCIKHDQGGTGHTNIQGTARFPVTNAEEAAALVRRANQARAVEATAMNAVSSRSHSVFMLYVTGFHEPTGTRLTGALNLVDLAGSERLDRSKAEGARQREACAINKSLSALGDVFQALAGRTAHVPYRNSKLTMLLQPCLGGDGKTLMFVNVNPEADSAGETLCSLRFAAKVNACETAARGGAKRNVVYGAGIAADDVPSAADSAAPPAAAAGGAGGAKRKATVPAGGAAGGNKHQRTGGGH